MAKYNQSDVKKLFADYEACGEKRAAAEEQVEKATAAQSDVVRKLFDLTGVKSWTRNGKTLKLMIRPSEKEAKKLAEEGKDIPPKRYFFRAESDQAVSAD